MSKQEEITEGIAQRLFWTAFPTGDWSVAVSQGYFRNQAKELLKYLHSQGVVIKADRELPEIPAIFRDYDGYERCKEDILKSGYVAVEPLIKE